MNENLKQQIRKQIKNERCLIPKSKKEILDENIASNLINKGILKNADLVLIYISTDIEVGTDRIINYCLDNSIKIAVPRCVGKRKMNFYYYNRNSQLEISRFGIREPVDDENNMVKDFDNSLCIVPGLSFDKRGYRLGYGGGFYDTFLAENPEIQTVGICYAQHVVSELPVNNFDRRVNFIVTENNVEVFNG